MQLRLSKYEGAGNDFVVVDGRGGGFPAAGASAELVRALCDRRRGIGADGVLVLREARSSAAAYRMEYFNADGGEADMCGNGARCLAAFAFAKGAAEGSFAFETAAGNYRGDIDAPDSVRISFPDIEGTPKNLSVEEAGARWDIDFHVVGVPHAVVWVEDASAVDVAAAGQALRWRDEFAPAGANVNFVEVVADGVLPILRVRTYERGVEGETLACGTGAVASAAAHARRLGVNGPFACRLTPTGGDELTVRFSAEADRLTGVELGGPARRVFDTVVEWDGAHLTPN